jgi:nitroreductase
MGTMSVTRPAARTADFAARFLARAALTAPSVHNTQPWRFVSHRDRIELYADLSRPLRVGDPSGREMVISCGAALFNVRLAIRHLGFVPRIRLLPDPGRPDLLASIGWGEYAGPTELDDRLYEVIRRRHTHRGPFDTEPISPWLLGELCDIARRQRASLFHVRDETERRRLAAIVRTAELVQRGDSRFTLERARWASAPEVMRQDGIPATAYPLQPDGLQVLFAGRDFAIGAPWGFPLRARRLDGRAVGAVAVLATSGDRRLDWLLTGEALQHLLLYATAHGAKVALHTQPLELPELRAKIRAQLLARNGHPQLILRLGHSSRVAPTPRRRVRDVLTEAE